MKRTLESFETHLVTKGLLTAEQIKKVRKECSETKEPFKKACLKLGVMNEEAYGAAEAAFFDMPFANLNDYTIDPEAVKLVPVAAVKKYGVFPLFKINGTLTIAIQDPTNILGVDQVRELTKFDVETVLATETDIAEAVREHYGMQGIADVAKAAHQSVQASRKDSKPEAMKLEIKTDIGESDKTDAPVVKLVDQTIVQAMEDRASDIHIEPEADFVRIRNRIDGALIEVAQLPKNLQNPVISRLKIMAKLDIAESRRPQDGKIRVTVNGKEVDIRVSSFPTTYGENIVLRILDRSNVVLDINRIGFSERLLSNFKTLIHRPHGILLVTGPTGAGKTTTLYAALQSINEVERNIVTIEDPVEYQLPMIRQTQVNPKAGLTFATGLRNLLRQDPDVMLVGEIRDRETAEVAVESALTGHLVLATLHTNDAPGSVTRLIEMGIEPFLVSSSLIGVLAQRLVRLICPSCKKAVPASELGLAPEHLKTLKDLNHHVNPKAGNDLTLYKGEGCKSCKRTGFRGRMAIFELMIVDEKIRAGIARRAPTSEIRNLAFDYTNTSMKTDGFMKVLSGLTTFEEVLKVVQQD